MMEDGDDEEMSEFNETPSKKKTPLNKVRAGRVTKGGRAKPVSYADKDTDEEDQDTIIKMEEAPVSSNGDYYENGYPLGGTEQDHFYAAEEDYGES